MKKDLMKMTQEWMQLERKTLEQRRQAEEFYESNLMTLIEEDFIRRNKEKVLEKVGYFVISVGTSYEPIVLNIKLFSPKRILFLYTEQTEKILNKIAEYCELNLQLRRDRRAHCNFLIMDFCGNLERQEKILGFLKDIPSFVKERRSMEILQAKEAITALMLS